jgi:hypothetical protein
MALKLARPCPHCDEDLTVLFKRDMSFDGGPLVAAVVHGLLEHLDWTSIKWKRVTGLDQMVRLPDGMEVPW